MKGRLIDYYSKKERKIVQLEINIELDDIVSFLADNFVEDGVKWGKLKSIFESMYNLDLINEKEIFDNWDEEFISWYKKAHRDELEEWANA